MGCEEEEEVEEYGDGEHTKQVLIQN